MYEQYVDNLGNLPLTAYNSELSDGSYKQKKECTVGGYKNEYLTISGEIRQADVWREVVILVRAEQLAERRSRSVVCLTYLWRSSNPIIRVLAVNTLSARL
ncbi:GmrSD restriction endonuclease domain-containing protein [Bifidobacterium xylocopae]|uniref:GmrSD restriction endonucleases C-terminal domain-containing protein n=1 Tax=Bifidobacterium xylocopae TaxID=2493119 RepID=A0A366KEK7_9BIFI|nr:DUF1524 domain-containing protein [Bifidobacterium xylocopae]RBP99827.1 hypothetical protein CRD59_01995 [Bifidobacterium xylocopae]